MTRPPARRPTVPRPLALRLSPADRARFRRLARALGGPRAALVAGMDALERLERERWRQARPFGVADDRDGQREPPPWPPDLEPAESPAPAGPPPWPAYHGKVQVREGAVVVGQTIPWYANAYDFVQAFAAEITVVALGRPFGNPPRQLLYYRISQIATAPGHVKVGDAIRLDGGQFVRVTRLNPAALHAGRPVVPASVAVAAAPEGGEFLTEFQIRQEKNKLPARTTPPAPYRRSFKEEVAIPDLLDDLSVAPEPVRQDLLAVFRLADRAPDAATDREFMAGVKAIWTDEERAAFRRVGAYRRRRCHGWEP